MPLIDSIPRSLSNDLLFVVSIVHGALVGITRANILVLRCVTGAIELNFKRTGCGHLRRAETSGMNGRGEANSCAIIAQQLDSCAS